MVEGEGSEAVIVRVQVRDNAQGGDKESWWPQEGGVVTEEVARCVVQHLERWRHLR